MGPAKFWPTFSATYTEQKSDFTCIYIRLMQLHHFQWTSSWVLPIQHQNWICDMASTENLLRWNLLRRKTLITMNFNIYYQFKRWVRRGLGFGLVWFLFVFCFVFHSVSLIIELATYLKCSPAVWCYQLWTDKFLCASRSQ